MGEKQLGEPVASLAAGVRTAWRLGLWLPWGLAVQAQVPAGQERRLAGAIAKQVRDGGGGSG